MERFSELRLQRVIGLMMPPVNERIYCPDDQLTKAQMAAFLSRVFLSKGTT
ncbi:MAG: hypothetical protein ACM3ON_00850 [Chloroflexota bacterium]